jgi:hypothetical protein
VLTAVFVLVLTSPFVTVVRAERACDEWGYPLRSATECRAQCRWWDPHDGRCRDVDVVSYGEWEPRPLPNEWPMGTTLPDPKEWGAYTAEQRSP